MRIQSTQAFSSATAAYDRTCASWAARSDFEDDPRFTEADVKRLETNMLSAADMLLRTSAMTSMDIVQKLDVMLEHGVDDDRAFGWRMIEDDINLMSRPSPGPDMHSAFSLWRTAWRDQAIHDASDFYSDTEATRLHGIMCDAMEAVFRVPCTTAGDFMVKAYVNLIWNAGHTNSIEARKLGTGNMFDVDLLEIDSDSLITDEYYRTVYDDLDHCDLGACLLAFGQIDFDPEQWLLAAERIGMAIALIVRGSAHAIAITMIESTDQRTDRLQREQRRLQRILSRDHDNRERVLAAYIIENRPDSIFTAPAKVAA